MVLEIDLRKKVDLLHYLELKKKQGSVLITELFKVMECSRTTLINYIDQINKLLGENFVQLGKKQISLNQFSNLDVTIVSTKLIEQSLNLRILFEIFFAKHSLHSLSQKFFASKATIIRRITYINDYFKCEGFDMYVKNLKTYEIVGDEAVIRKFFQKILVETNFLYKLSSREKYFLTELSTITKKFFPLISEQLFLNERNAYIYASLHRSGHSHYLYKDIDIMNFNNKFLVYINKMYDRFIKCTPLVNFFETKFCIKFTKHIFLNLFNLDFLQFIFNLNKNDSFLNEYKLSSSIKNIILHYSNLLNTSLTEKEIKCLTICLCGKLSYSNLRFVLQDEVEINFEYLLQKDFYRTEQLYSLMKRDVFLKNIDDYFLKDLVIQIFVLDEFLDYKITNNKSSIHIAILNTGFTNLAILLKNSLEKKYGNSVKDTIKIEIIDNLKDPRVKSSNILISEIYSDELKDKIIHLPRVITSDFWNKIDKKISM
ncbi:helix-turn-helix domain-containing protein [Enterococcus faecalis]|uniref:helix-turn-helix domain-containing protein n=1 Tax=Enterococcus faecalis TaxID=1351 RepID=UPI0025B11CD7|nr:helix-turn-helix domain-containing protein [Enterococcus faecalis]MDN3185476.1 helix-turn-helix domain-containing protein [Enterococcus faecalis]